jgi:4-hydroxybenzoate polyprenyltransferase
LPIFEIFIIALGFLLRLIAGSLSTNIEISNWLFLTVLSIALFLATGKRRNEFIHVNNSTNSTRRVLKHYSLNFLDSFMNVFLTMIVIFYSLWTIQVHPEFSNNLVWSVPIVLFIVMKYSLILDGDRHGDPTDLLLSNKVLIFSILFFTLYVFGVFYI